MDVKLGSSIRDVVIDGPSQQLSYLYEEVNKAQSAQSPRTSIGTDLDKYFSSYTIPRKTGSVATVSALCLFSVLDSDFVIPKGTLALAKNGSSFTVLNNTTVAKALASTYKSLAAKYKSDLDFLGLTESYAVQVTLQATAPGVQGNVPKYGMASISSDTISNIVNVVPGGGGSAAENDAAYRNRAIAALNGANTGTSTGYAGLIRNSSIAVTDVQVIEPGDDLMTRDGTQVSIAEDGTRTIISEGTGGKIDLIVFGASLQQTSDSYVYHDKSNTGDPTNSANDFVLGQLADDAGKTVTRKRIDDLKSGVLPNQPINNIISVSGSVSGPNFVEKSVDEFGRVTGNYELVKDTGAYAGSPWAFDKLRWINNQIDDFNEDRTKSTFNGQDPLTYLDVTGIEGATQNIVVTNENSTVSPSNRTSIQLDHFPVTSVTRVFNLSTGERYVVTNQNPDGTGSLNVTGRIIISGKSLPSISDNLQVDYTWVYSYDPYIDFDNKSTDFNIRTVEDSIDWGFSNRVARERTSLVTSGSFLTATVTHPISSVVSLNTFVEETSSISLVSGRLAVVVATEVTNVVSVTRSDGAQLYRTSENDGSFSGFTIYLPSDTVGSFGQVVTVVYNASDIYTGGSFSGNVITVPSTSSTAGTIVEANYLANVNTLLPATLFSNLPALRNQNTWSITGTNSLGYQPTSNLFSGSTVVQNLRQAPSPLGLTVNGTISPGIFLVSGTSLLRVEGVLTATAAGLTVDLSAAARTALGLNSKQSLPSTYKVVRLIQVNKVETSGNTITSTLDQLDILNYQLVDNSFWLNESVQDSSLSVFQIKLPSTSHNLSNTIEIGDRLSVIFYLANTLDTEEVAFTKPGTLYTNKRWLTVASVGISSGFSSSTSPSATLTLSNLNQPVFKTRYKGIYNYTAPKANERITITSFFNKLIDDATLAIEVGRPVTDDVLVKGAETILADVTMYVVVSEAFVNSAAVVIQNVQDAVSAALTVSQGGATVDSSDLVNTAYSISGVDRVRVYYFNKTGENGSVLSIIAQRNQAIQANQVTIIKETR